MFSKFLFVLLISFDDSFFVPGALLGCTAVFAYPMAMPYPGGPMAGPDPYAMPMPNQFSGPMPGPMPGPDPMAFQFGGPIASADPYGYPSANPTSFGRAGPGPQPNANPFGNPNPYANAFAQPEAYGAPSYYNF